VTCRVFRALGGADILVNQAVEDGFSADLPCADVGHGRGVSVGFIVGDALAGLRRVPDLAWFVRYTAGEAASGGLWARARHVIM